MTTAAAPAVRSLRSVVANQCTEDPLKSAVQIIKDRLYFTAIKAKLAPKSSFRIDADGNKKQIHYFCIDAELVYWNFFLDYGPLNLGQLYRFCTKLNEKLASATLADHTVCFYSNSAPTKRANAVCLICSWQILYLNRSPEEALHGFRLAVPGTPFPSVVPTQQATTGDDSIPFFNASAQPLTRRDNPTIGPLPSFHDASPCPCTFDLTVLDCLRGLAKARMHGFFDFESFDVNEYEHFEQVENGDLNWIIYGKILAFAGPSYERRVSPEGYCTLSPSDYIPYFKEKKVGLVVRLNRKAYHEEDFKKAGIDHFDQFYTDGSCPPMKILDRVVGEFDNVPEDKAFAVHCKAGLGRTGTCIGAWIMKHYRFTASEVIAWMRMCRPGMVIGPQQQFLKEVEQRMWQLGALEGSPKSGLETLANVNTNCKADVPTKKMTMTTQNNTDSDEATVGRAGQADGLLSARSRNKNVSAVSSRAYNKDAAAPPSPQTTKQTTPQAVTPDPPGKSRSTQH